MQTAISSSQIGIGTVFAVSILPVEPSRPRQGQESSFDVAGYGPPGTAVGAGDVTGLAATPDGSFYYESGGALVQIRASGSSRYLGGAKSQGETTLRDGLQATEARLRGVSSLAANEQGDVFVAITGNEPNKIWKLDNATGTFELVAGRGSRGLGGDGGEARDALLNSPPGPAL